MPDSYWMFFLVAITISIITSGTFQIMPQETIDTSPKEHGSKFV